jgi:hypothetical protein
MGKTKNKVIGITAVFLIVAIGNYAIFTSYGSTRTVEFLSSFAIGALSGVLILQIAKAIKERKK